MPAGNQRSLRYRCFTAIENDRVSIRQAVVENVQCLSCFDDTSGECGLLHWLVRYPDWTWMAFLKYYRNQQQFFSFLPGKLFVECT